MTATSGHGGGVFINSSSLTLADRTPSGNTAAPVTPTGDTLAANSDGVRADGATVTLAHTLLANTGAPGTGVFASSDHNRNSDVTRTALTAPATHPAGTPVSALTPLPQPAPLPTPPTATVTPLPQPARH